MFPCRMQLSYEHLLWGGWKGNGHDTFDCQFEVVVHTVNPELHEQLALAVHLPTSDCLRHLYEQHVGQCGRMTGNLHQP